MLTALTRQVSTSIVDCALSFHQRQPIEVALARRQHEQYQDVLQRLGAQILSAREEPELPDAVFVEDAAVVVDEVAVITAPLLPARRQETTTVAEALTP